MLAVISLYLLNNVFINATLIKTLVIKLL